MYYEILVQGIGVLGIAASVISFQCKKHSAILTLKTVSELLFALQYVLLGAYTGAAMNVIGCVRNTVFTKMVKDGKKTTKMCVFFSFMFLVFTAVTWAGPKSILVGVAKVLSTVAYGNKNTKVVRRLILITSVSWLVYNICVHSIAGAACEALTICSIIVGIMRMEVFSKSHNVNN